MAAAGAAGTGEAVGQEPQVAACADWQWSISKETRKENAGDITVSHVTPLDAAGRVEEIARLLGDVKITDTTYRHAREMIGVSAPESD